jgi:hypothetical protein
MRVDQKRWISIRTASENSRLAVLVLAPCHRKQWVGAIVVWTHRLCHCLVTLTDELGIESRCPCSAMILAEFRQQCEQLDEPYSVGAFGTNDR